MFMQKNCQKNYLDYLQQSLDRKSTRLNSSHLVISYAVFCLKKKLARFGPPGPQEPRVCLEVALQREDPDHRRHRGAYQARGASSSASPSLRASSATIASPRP